MHDSDNEGTISEEVSLLDTEIHDSNLNLHKLPNSAGTSSNHKWDKVFQSGLSKFCGRQPLKNYLAHS